MENKHSKSKRRFLAALAGGAVATPALFSQSLAQAATIPPFEARLAPKYYPKPDHVSEIDLAGKVAVITGASRGIGLATGLALQALGVQVIGTSRTPQDYPGHPFPLIALELEDAASIQAFVSTVLSCREVQNNGGIDILVNNAGRYVFGGVIPTAAAPELYFSGIQSALAALYAGHIAVTSSLLQSVAARAASGYGRILFTTSVAAYIAGGVDVSTSFLHSYVSGKRALLAYANSLRNILDLAGMGIKVSTVNPFGVNTDLPKGTRPIFLQPVDADGNAIGDADFQYVLDAFRALHANALPPSYAAQAYVQLLTSISPEVNVAMASDVEPYATQAGNDLIVGILTNEMKQSALPWVAGPSQV